MEPTTNEPANPLGLATRHELVGAANEVWLSKIEELRRYAAEFIERADEMELYSQSVASYGLVVVTDATSKAAAGERLQVLAEVKKNVAALWKPLKDAINYVKDLVLEREHAALDPLVALDVAQKQAIGAWTLAETRRVVALEAQARVEEVARETARRDAHVKELDDAGQHDEAKAVEREPIRPSAVVLRAPEKVKGARETRVYKWDPVDVSKAKCEFHTWDTKAVDAKVRALGFQAERVVGEGSIKVREEVAVAAAPKRGSR